MYIASRICSVCNKRVGTVIQQDGKRVMICQPCLEARKKRDSIRKLVYDYVGAYGPQNFESVVGHVVVQSSYEIEEQDVSYAINTLIRSSSIELYDDGVSFVSCEQFADRHIRRIEGRDTSTCPVCGHAESTFVNPTCPACGAGNAVLFGKCRDCGAEHADLSHTRYLICDNGHRWRNDTGEMIDKVGYSR